MLLAFSGVIAMRVDGDGRRHLGRAVEQDRLRHVDRLLGARRIGEGRGPLAFRHRADAAGRPRQAVGADDLDVAVRLAGALGREPRAGRHHVVAGIDHLDVGMRLQHRGEGGLRLVRQPVGGLLGDDLDLRVALDAVLEAVQPLDRRRRARQALQHRDLAAVRQQRLGGIFARRLGDLVVVAADEGRVVLAGIADRLAVELDHRDAGVHRPLHRRGQRRRLERRDQQQVDLLGDEVVDLRGLRVHVAGAVGDLQRELRHRPWRRRSARR